MNTQPNTAQAPAGVDGGDVQVSVESVLAAYAREVATLTQRAIMAETARDAALARLTEVTDSGDPA